MGQIDKNAKYEIEQYGDNAANWLNAWDAGKTVWSVSMGGLSAGYEQAIQITAAEVLRHLLERRYDVANWSDEDKWRADRNEIETAVLDNPVVDAMGITGAMWGAAMNLGTILYRRGPQAMNDDAIKSRLIQVTKS